MSTAIKRSFFIVVFAHFLLGSLSACSSSGGLPGSSEPATRLSSTPQSELTIATRMATSAQADPTEAVLPIPTMTATPVPSSSTETPPATSLPEATCPTFSNTVQFPGTLIYNVGSLPVLDSPFVVAPDESVILGMTDDIEPKLIAGNMDYVSVSPSGNYLREHELQVEQEGLRVTFYNLLDGSQWVTMVSEIAAYNHWRWQPDDIFLYTIKTERMLGIGENLELLLLDPTSQRTEHFSLSLMLPDYYFGDYTVGLGTPAGFAIVDPTFERVIYTAQKGDISFIRLLDLETQQILWESESGTPSVLPEWSFDGSHVLLKLPQKTDEGDFWSKFIILTRDGEETVLPSQPYPGTEGNILTNLVRSADGRFIFYSRWDFLKQQNQAFILDSIGGVVRELCDETGQLLSHFPQGDGGINLYWLPEGQLVYISLLEKRGQPAHSLRVLDIPTWTVRVLHETEPGRGINLFGWTLAVSP